MASPYNPYQAPTFDQGAEVDRDEELTLATRGSRLAAAMVDSALFFVPVIAVFLVMETSLASLLVLGESENFGGPSEDLMKAVGVVVVLCAILLVAQCYFLVKNAQTIGKRLLGIQIVNAGDGRPTGFARIVFLRIMAVQLGSLFPFIGSFLPLVDVLLIFRRDSRCLHDLIAGTIVVKVER